MIGSQPQLLPGPIIISTTLYMHMHVCSLPLQHLTFLERRVALTNYWQQNSLLTMLQDVQEVASHTFSPSCTTHAIATTKLKFQKVVSAAPLLAPHDVPQASRAHYVMLIASHLACKAHGKTCLAERHSHMAKS